MIIKLVSQKSARLERILGNLIIHSNTKTHQTGTFITLNSESKIEKSPDIPESSLQKQQGSKEGKEVKYLNFFTLMFSSSSESQ